MPIDTAVPLSEVLTFHAVITLNTDGFSIVSGTLAFRNRAPKPFWHIIDDTEEFLWAEIFLRAIGSDIGLF